MEGARDQPVVQPRRVDSDRRRHGAQEVTDGGVAAEAEQALLRLLCGLEVRRILELADALERGQGDAHTFAELERAPLVLAEEGTEHPDPGQHATQVALLRLWWRIRRAPERGARCERRKGLSAAGRPDALL